ncbi:unnamed protein product [Brassica rapa]|uniref:Uncharacterized protein n=1 Tax=Brassica campestris TaxID=3711 RepID=A0A8D9HLS0_BRACM|nr:unnamed protein product [Brassica rapa]
MFSGHVTLVFVVGSVQGREGGSRSRMRNVVQLRRVGQVSGAAGYDGSSESSSSSESMSDSNFENENVVKSTESSHVTVSSKFEEAGVLEEIEEESVHLEGINFSKAWKPFRKHHPTHSTSIPERPVRGSQYQLGLGKYWAIF